jgi:hypothetical protein
MVIEPPPDVLLLDELLELLLELDDELLLELDEELELDEPPLDEPPSPMQLGIWRLPSWLP